MKLTEGETFKPRLSPPPASREPPPRGGHLRDAHFLFRRDLALYRVAAGGEDAGGGRDLDGDRDGLLAYRQADALAVDLRDYAVGGQLLDLILRAVQFHAADQADRISIS